ncbi:SMAD/FHA domain-containing protein [Cryphonectria parasitica EP155]|uniref:SMAD/FHA domain-containing protein n=1 Tax=Cryphonectria parasitica (strain ATCC 38755 / EP155) TaxID=660469 RepID=A0A9P4XZT6_CRYP1|nr:SMAD/FHA domain-containing protein [Cryphonectria parasitica EP155]KAF3763782.1 SMAD/FHA domain-containing protein [Cryphonectria parasitica EP155]
MGSDASYDEDGSRYSKNRDSSDKTSRRDRSRDRDDNRHRRRRRSRSPESRRHSSRDRGGRRDKRARDSRSPEDDSYERRRSRRVEDNLGDEGRSSRKKHKQRESRWAEDEDQHEERERRRRRHQDAPLGDAEPAENQVAVRRGGPLPSQADSFAVSNGEEPEKPKEKPNFGNTGVLAAASNSVTQADGTTITLKYHEPPESRKPPPRDQWKLFVFKGKDIVDTIELSTRSCWLVGREPTVVDLLAENPSISKQHAVIQFRYTEKRNEFGDKIGKVKPYLIDLESANHTKLNGEEVPDRRYLELRPKDVVKFGSSEREYVVMLSRD